MFFTSQTHLTFLNKLKIYKLYTENKILGDTLSGEAMQFSVAVIAFGCERLRLTVTITFLTLMAFTYSQDCNTISQCSCRKYSKISLALK